MSKAQFETFMTDWLAEHPDEPMAQDIWQAATEAAAKIAESHKISLPGVHTMQIHRNAACDEIASAIRKQD